MRRVLHASCNASAHTQLIARFPRAPSSDWFQSTVMLYPTSLLGRWDEALVAIVALYQAFGGIVEGDQDILSLYWIHQRQAARSLPMQGPNCLYDYTFRKPHPSRCQTFVLTKLSYAQALRVARSGSAWRGGPGGWRNGGHGGLT